MRRRDLIALVGATVAWPRRGHAQRPSNIPRVGDLISLNESEGRHLWVACRQGLREPGYVKGQNLNLVLRVGANRGAFQ
jgi:putative ABC transport system substrate-binding protein